MMIYNVNKVNTFFFIFHLGSQVCHDYLVSGPHGVPDRALTSSSQWNSRLPNDNNGPERSRLFTTAHDYGNGTYDRGAWSSAYNDKNQYIQVNPQLAHSYEYNTIT